MTINKTRDGNTMTVTLDGRLDTTTAPQLERELRSSVDGLTELIFDLEKLEYVSSAGLRVLLAAQKVMNKQGEMVVQNTNREIMDIFEVTGFVDILNIKE